MHVTLDAFLYFQIRPYGDISLYLLGISPTLFASFPYQFASFSHQICFISPKKCVISPTKCCISPTNCFIYPTVCCISPCNFVSLCQFTKIWFYQVFSIFRCHSISKHLPLGWVSVWVGQWVEEKSLTNVSIVKSVENIWEFCEKLFPKPTFQICNVLNQHMRKKLWLWFCDKCGKYFITTLCWRCTQWATSTKNCEFCEKIFPKPTSLASHVYSYRRRRIVLGVKNILSNSRSWKCTNFATVGPQKWHVY